MENSIIITNFNYEKYIARAIRSAINQSFDKNEYEIIVIDDCSTDTSKSVIDSFSGYVRTIYNDTNIGLPASCNKAIRQAKGKFSYFLDADDFINKDTLLVCYSFASHNKENFDAVSSDYYEVSEKETILKRRDGMAYPIRCGILFYTDHLIELGPYTPGVIREDIDFRNRYMKSGKYIYNLPVPYYRYTMHNDSLTKNME